MSRDLPHPLVAFISASIGSIEELEILLLLRESSNRDFTIEELNELIRSQPESIRMRLSSLSKSGLISPGTREGSVRYTATGPLEERVSELASAYRDRRTRVIELVYSKPLREMRDFSDAFKLRKKGDPHNG